MQNNATDSFTKDKLRLRRKPITRLGWYLPVCIWPVIIFIDAQGDYSTGRHSAAALYPVVTQLFSLNIVLSLLGIVLILCGERGTGTRVGSILWVLIHFFGVVKFLFDNARLYV